MSAAVKRKDEEVTLERQEAQRQLKKKEQEIKKLKLSEDAALELESLHSNLLGQARPSANPTPNPSPNPSPNPTPSPNPDPHPNQAAQREREILSPSPHRTN